MASSYETAYQELWVDFMPRPIRSQREYRKACRRIGNLMKGRTNLPRAESEILEVLSLLVEKYESETYPIRDASPAEILAYLMEQKGVSDNPLAGVATFSPL